MLFHPIGRTPSENRPSQRIRGFITKRLEETEGPPARAAVPGRRPPGLKLSSLLFLSPPPRGRDALVLLPFGKKGRHGPEPTQHTRVFQERTSGGASTTWLILFDRVEVVSLSFVPTSLGTHSLTGGTRVAGRARREVEEARKPGSLFIAAATTSWRQHSRANVTGFSGLLAMDSCVHTYFFSLLKAPGHMY